MVEILVVDDSPVDRLLISATLQRGTDWNSTPAENGRQAIEAMMVMDTTAKLPQEFEHRTLVHCLLEQLETP